MKKLFSLTIIVFIVLFFQLNVKGQFVLTGKIGNVPTNVYHMCIGDTLDLNSSKSNYLMNNDFNTGTLGPGWSTNVTPLWSNPCPPLNNGASGIVLWFGGSTFPRELITVGYDIHCYKKCYVEFDMKYGANQNSANCESPDIAGTGDINDPAGEGVHLLYSTNGSTWTQFPGINIPGSGGYWTPVAGNAATGPYYSWNHYSNELPIDAISTNTRIRWYQNVASGNVYDHWGIDNVQISCPVQPYVSWSCPERLGWSFPGFNPNPFVATQAGVFHYIVSIIDLSNPVNFICPEIDTVTVIVHDPKVNAIPDLSICRGNSTILTETVTAIPPVTYQWNTTPITTTASLTVHPYDTTVYIITIKDSLGCKAKDTVTVNVIPLPVIITTNDSVCKFETATISASGGVIYEWSTGAINSTINVAPLDTTTYPVKVTDQYGCYDTSSAIVVIYPIPIIEHSPDITVCLGSQTTLTASGGVSYLWNTNPTDTNSNNLVTPTDSVTIYKVIVTDINECVDSATISVTTIPLPTPTISKEIDTLCKGSITTISSSGGTSYLWNTGEVTPSVSVRPLISTVYNVTISNITNNVECSKDTSILQLVRNCYVIYVPNAFIPTGYNTVFKPIGDIGEPQTYQFAIYNRWGQLVFQTTDVNQGWDGKFNGEFVPAGAYVYYLLIDNGYEEPYEKIGTVTVIQ